MVQLLLSQRLLLHISNKSAAGHRPSRTRATIEVHHVYVRFPQFGSIRLLQKTDLEKRRTAMIPRMKTSHGLGTHDETHAKKKMAGSNDFGLRKPRHSENVSAKKRYTSIVARVLANNQNVQLAKSVARRISTF